MKKHTQKYCVIFVNLYSASYVTNCLWTLVTWESEASLDTSGALQTSVCMSCNKPKGFKNIKLLMQMTWCRKALIRNFCSFACVQSNLYRAGNLQRCYSQAAPPLWFTHLWPKALKFAHLFYPPAARRLLILPCCLVRTEISSELLLHHRSPPLSSGLRSLTDFSCNGSVDGLHDFTLPPKPPKKQQ